MDKLIEFCKRWNVRELSLFGSALRDDFRPDSDIDLLASFDPASRLSLLDHATMELELEALLGRRVDLIDRSSVEQSENPIRRRHILSTARVLYAA